MPAGGATTVSPGELPPVEAGKYAVTGEHARGGLGRIMRARDLRLGRPVAIKELLRPDVDDEARFAREALVTARLQHPAIVPVYEAGRWPDGRPFYAMKLVQGSSLEQVIRETYALEERVALLPHVIHVVEALAYAHGQRIIHRDLKPANVLVGAYGETVVIDWGLAKDLARPADIETVKKRRVAAEGETVEGSVMGTPAYMPPEQARGETVDERADVYALGAVLYHVLCGDPPYTGASSNEVLAQVISGPPIPLEERERRVPPDLLTIVRKAMAYEPRDRYPTAQELSEDLNRYQRGQLVSAHVYSTVTLFRRWLKRHRGPVAVAAVFLCLLAALAVVGVRRIVRERDRAERQRAEAEAAHAEAERRNDELSLIQARVSLDRDPRVSLGWLKLLTTKYDGWGAARVIAADALSRGVPLKSLRLDGPAAELAVSPDGRVVVVAITGDGKADGKLLTAWDVTADDVLKTPRIKAESPAIAFDGRTLAYAADGPAVGIWDITEITFKTKRPALRKFRGVNDHDVHDADLTAVALTTDGKWIASGSRDGTVRLWDTRTRDSFVLDHGAVVTHVTFKPDGKWLATAAADGTVRLWEVQAARKRETRRPVIEERHAGAVTTLRFSAGGDLLASAGEDDRAFVFTLADSGKRVLEGHRGDVTGLAFAPDGKRLVTAGRDGSVFLWDLVAPRLLPQPIGSHDQAVLAITFSPDGRSVASASADDTVRIWDIETGIGRTLRGHEKDVTALAWAQDGRRLFSAGQDGMVLCWETAAWDGIVLGDPADPVSAVAWSAAGDALAWGTAGGKVRVHYPRTGEYFVVAAHAGRVTGLAFSPDGGRLASAGWDDLVMVWDSRDGATGRTQVVGQAPADVTAIAYSGDGRTLVWGRGDGVVEAAGPAAGQRTALPPHGGGVAALSVSHDGSTVASVAIDQTLQVRELDGGKVVYAVAGAGKLVDAVLGADGRSLVWAGEWSVKLVDLKGGAEAELPAGGGPVTDLALSADGRQVAAAARDRTVTLWDLTAVPRHARRLTGHGEPIVAVVFSRDGVTLASAGEDDTVRLWDVATGEGRALVGHGGDVVALAFAPDGRLASGSLDGRVRIWLDQLPRDPEALHRWLETAGAVDVRARAPRATSPGTP